MINNIYLLPEQFIEGFGEENLDILSIISILCGILVIISKNPIISVLFLIGLFLTISIYLILLGINFIGISYILVYIGAISILFLFILMLINVRVSELLSETSNSIPLAVVISIAFSVAIRKVMPFSTNNINSKTEIDFYKENYKKEGLNIENIKKENEGQDLLAQVSTESWDNKLTDISHVNSIGNVLYTNYSIWLIITSIILLLAMVGCIIITIRQK